MTYAISIINPSGRTRTDPDGPGQTRRAARADPDGRTESFRISVFANFGQTARERARAETGLSSDGRAGGRADGADEAENIYTKHVIHVRTQRLYTHSQVTTRSRHARLDTFHPSAPHSKYLSPPHPTHQTHPCVS